MRSHLCLKAAIMGGAFSLLALGATAQAQEVLTNGNLDAIGANGQLGNTPNGWNVNAFRTSTGPYNDGASSEPWCNVADAGGFGLFFKPFTGNLTTGDKANVQFFQINPATPGQTYTMTGWAGAEPNYVGLSDSTVKSEFRLSFLNAANAVVGSVILDLAANNLGQPGGVGGFNYRQYSLQGVAPAGTTQVRALAQMLNAYGNPAGGAQAFVVDAFSVTVPEPTTLGLASVGAMGLLIRRRK